MSFTKEQIDQYTKERGGYGGRHSPHVKMSFTEDQIEQNTKIQNTKYKIQNTKYKNIILTKEHSAKHHCDRREQRGGYGGRHSPRPSVKIAKVICLLKQRKGATSFVNFVGR